MSNPDSTLAVLSAKEEIRTLALLYCRGVDRKDTALLRTLYTQDGTDDHGIWFNGSKEGYVDFLAAAMPFCETLMHHVTNHLISVTGDTAEGEVYALAFDRTRGADGSVTESITGVRYLDRYRLENGRWRFAHRKLATDFWHTRPAESTVIPSPADDASYHTLTHALFARNQ